MDETRTCRPSHLDRARTLERLGAETFDILVVGGGITGAGAAREAARRGLRVALVERSDLASGTSSKSSKLVHGGLRYLEQLELGLVFEAVSERRVLQDIAPHLVRPLPFLFPVYAWSRRGPRTIQLGMWVYETLNLFRSPKRPRSLKPGEVAKEEPLLVRDDLKGASVYYDCATDDVRLTLETALDAAEQGAAIATHVRVASFARERGRIVGAELEDMLGGGRIALRARAVINATGPWTDRVREAGAPLLRPTKGIHIVVPAERLPVKHAVVTLHPGDGRVLFAIPWGARTYIGTTDTDFEGDPADARATSADVRYCLDVAAHYFPEARLGPEDVISTWAGLRPLIAGDGSPSSVSREHEVIVDDDGLVTIAGGKLTTYRRMAVEVVDKAVSLLRLAGEARRLPASDTEEVALPGGRGWPEDDELGPLVAEVRAAAKERIAQRDAERLAWVYGTRARDVAAAIGEDEALAAPLVSDRPNVLAEVDWAVREELAETVSDVLSRRLLILLKARCQGLSCVDAVAARMAARLGWDAARVAREVGAYRAEVETSRAWRDEGEPAPADASDRVVASEG